MELRNDEQKISFSATFDDELALQLISIVKLSCKSVNFSLFSNDEFHAQILSGGLSNRLFTVSIPKTNEKVVVRVFNDNPILTPLQSYQVYTAFAKNNMGPKIYGTFGNGQIEQYLAGKNPTNDELSNTNGTKNTLIYLDLAQIMAKLHKFDLGNIFNQNDIMAHKTSNYFLNIIDNLPEKDYTKQIQVKTDNDNNNKITLKTAKELTSMIKKEMEWITNELNMFKYGFINDIVFSHNDIHAKNMIFNDTNKERKNSGRLTLIDYEFVGYNYRCFDLATFFNELATNLDYPKYPYFELNYSKFPTFDFQKKFVEYYCKESGFVIKNNNQLNEIVNGIKLGCLFQHIVTIVWSFAESMMRPNDPNFGYFEFGHQRFNIYFKVKNEYILNKTSTKTQKIKSQL